MNHMVWQKKITKITFMFAHKFLILFAFGKCYFSSFMDRVPTGHGEMWHYTIATSSSPTLDYWLPLFVSFRSSTHKNLLSSSCPIWSALKCFPMLHSSFHSINFRSFSNPKNDTFLFLFAWKFSYWIRTQSMVFLASFFVFSSHLFNMFRSHSSKSTREFTIQRYTHLSIYTHINYIYI